MRPTVIAFNIFLNSVTCAVNVVLVAVKELVLFIKRGKITSRF